MGKVSAKRKRQKKAPANIECSSPSVAAKRKRQKKAPANIECSSPLVSSSSVVMKKCAGPFSDNEASSSLLVMKKCPFSDNEASSSLLVMKKCPFSDNEASSSLLVMKKCPFSDNEASSSLLVMKKCAGPFSDNEASSSSVVMKKCAGPFSDNEASSSLLVMKKCPFSDNEASSSLLVMKKCPFSDNEASSSLLVMKKCPFSDNEASSSLLVMKKCAGPFSDNEASSSSVVMKKCAGPFSDNEASSSLLVMKKCPFSDNEASSSLLVMKKCPFSDNEASSSLLVMKKCPFSDNEASSSLLVMKKCAGPFSDNEASSSSVVMKKCAGPFSDNEVRKRVKSIECSANDGELGTNQDFKGVSEDELRGQLVGDHEKVLYFRTTASGDDEQALQRTKNLSHSAFPDMKQSGSKKFNVKNLAEIFKLQGNKAMQSKMYPAAIDWYNVAIALGGDNAIYYCDRAAAYIQTCQYAEAILDCQKSIAIDPNYIKAHTRLGYIYFVQGIDALEKGYRIATLLDPTNVSVRENVRAAEHKIWQQREESGQTSNWSYSNGVMSVRDQVLSPLFGNNSGAGLQASAMGPADTDPGVYAAIRADISFLVALRRKTATNSNGN